MEVLIQWRGLPQHESMWMKIQQVRHQFPSFQLEGKLNLDEEGIDRPWRVYTRKRRGEKQI